MSDYRDLRIARGVLAEKSSKEDSTLYTEFEGKKYYYKEYGKVDGKSQGITGKIKKVSTSFEYQGKKIDTLSVTIINDDGNFNINVREKSKHWKHFVGKLVNCDFSKEVTIKPYDFVSKDMKEIVGTNFYQDGVKISNKAFEMDYPKFEGEWKDLSDKDRKKAIKKAYKFFYTELGEVCP